MMPNLSSIKRLSSPPVFFRAAGSALRVLVPLSFLLGIAGFAAALAAPADAQQGEVYRVLYVHVPAAWMSMLLYLLASGYALLHWTYRTPVSAVMMRALLPTGAWMTLAALATGSLWGKPTWGTWWVWDARLTSELLLLFLYLGLMAIASLVDDESKTDRVLALFIVVGCVNIPLIYFSVVFWNTLHQGPSLGAAGAARMATDMKLILLVCTLALWSTCAALVLARARWMLAEREQDAAWPQKEIA